MQQLGHGDSPVVTLSPPYLLYLQLCCLHCWAAACYGAPHWRCPTGRRSFTLPPIVNYSLLSNGKRSIPYGLTAAIKPSHRAHVTPSLVFVVPFGLFMMLLQQSGRVRTVLGWPFRRAACVIAPLSDATMSIIMLQPVVVYATVALTGWHDQLPFALVRLVMHCAPRCLSSTHCAICASL